MGGFFGVVNKHLSAVSDVFYGTDYHSHLGTRSGGIASFDKEKGIVRQIHNITNSPFKTKFEDVFDTMQGSSAIGCINDSNPQPLIIKSKLGVYALIFTGSITNLDELINECLNVKGGHFQLHSGMSPNQTELVAAFIDQKDSFEEGIAYVHERFEGTISILILKDDGKIICARDKWGRLPVKIGKNADGLAVSFESFAYQKLGYEDYYELGPAEIVEVGDDDIKILKPREKQMKICSFLWSYYGYPTSTYEGKNVEVMRYNNGRIMMENDKAQGKLHKFDYIAGVPDSGTPHAIGYANSCGVPFGRPFIKYTPTYSRSFMPTNQSERNKVAKMKMVPVKELIEDKDLLFIDDSIVRGTQMRETVEFLYANGAKSVHVRSACPPIMFGCKYLNFTRSISDMELITRDTIVKLEGEKGLEYMEEYADPTTERGKKLREVICDNLHLSSLEFQTLDGLVEAIGLPECKLCTYCWNGKE